MCADIADAHYAVSRQGSTSTTAKTSTVGVKTHPMPASAPTLAVHVTTPPAHTASSKHQHANSSLSNSSHSNSGGSSSTGFGSASRAGSAFGELGDSAHLKRTSATAPHVLEGKRYVCILSSASHPSYDHTTSVIRTAVFSLQEDQCNSPSCAGRQTVRLHASLPHRVSCIVPLDWACECLHCSDAHEASCPTMHRLQTLGVARQQVSYRWVTSALRLMAYLSTLTSPCYFRDMLGQM